MNEDIESMIGEKFNNLTVIEFDINRYENDIIRKECKEIKQVSKHLICKCTCGNVISVAKSNLKNNHTKSCGCTKHKKSNEKRQLNIQNMIGERFGRLTVIKYIGEENKKDMFECICDCGNLKTTSKLCLLYGNTTSCGCYFKQRLRETKFQDLTGMRFGLLLVMSLHSQNSRYDSLYMCKCDCGNATNVFGHNLKRGNTTSCGCYKGSKGEENISKYLRNHNILFIRQKMFSDFKGCKGWGLKYDFYIESHNILIEFNGIQHEKYNPHFHRIYDDFITQVENDKLKIEYADTKNINLITIWYYEQTKIKEILDNIFEGSETLVS